jgi:hypothetical protein
MVIGAPIRVEAMSGVVQERPRHGVMVEHGSDALRRDMVIVLSQVNNRGTPRRVAGKGGEHAAIVARCATQVRQLTRG